MAQDEQVLATVRAGGPNKGFVRWNQSSGSCIWANSLIIPKMVQTSTFQVEKLQFYRARDGGSIAGHEAVRARVGTRFTTTDIIFWTVRY